MHRDLRQRVLVTSLEDQRRNHDGGRVDRFLRLRAQGEYPLQHALALLELHLVRDFGFRFMMQG